MLISIKNSPWFNQQNHMSCIMVNVIFRKRIKYKKINDYSLKNCLVYVLSYDGVFCVHPKFASSNRTRPAHLQERNKLFRQRQKTFSLLQVLKQNCSSYLSIFHYARTHWNLLIYVVLTMEYNVEHFINMSITTNCPN